MKLQSASARQKYKYEEKSKKLFLSMHTAEAPAMLSHGLNQQTTNKHLSLHDPEAKSQETDFTGFHYFPYPVLQTLPATTAPIVNPVYRYGCNLNVSLQICVKLCQRQCAERHWSNVYILAFKCSRRSTMVWIFKSGLAFHCSEIPMFLMRL